MMTSAPKKSLDRYFDLTAEMIAKVSPKSVVLQKVGVFYEVYGYKNEVDADYAGSLISDVARVCNLSICEQRSLTFNGAKVYHIGFRDVKLEKFKELLNAASYSVVTLTKQDNHEYKVDSLLPLANAITA